MIGLLRTNDGVRCMSAQDGIVVILQGSFILDGTRI